MTRRAGLAALIAVLLGSGVLLMWRIAVNREAHLAVSGPPGRSPPPQRNADATVEEIAEQALPSHDLPPHVKRAAEEMVRLAQAANLYNFDPRITAFRDNKHPFRSDVTNLMIGTPTHIAQFISGRLASVDSLYDGSDERRKPGVVREWYKCTGTWTKDEAIQEALAILERLGDTETLEAVLPGKKEYRASEMGNIARTPDGQATRVRPFPKVDLYDANGTRRVGIEFRMGPTGVVGVTRFWRWP